MPEKRKAEDDEGSRKVIKMTEKPAAKSSTAVKTAPAAKSAAVAKAPAKLASATVYVSL